MSDGPEIVLSSVTDTSNLVPSTRRINTVLPLAGGGDLTADRTLSIVPITNARRFLFCNGAMSFMPGIGGNTGLASQGANRVVLMPMEVPYPITIAKWTFNVTVGPAAAGNTANFGLYDPVGNLIFDSGALAIDSLGVKSGGVGAGVTVCGLYLFAWGATINTIVTFSISPITATATNTILNFNTQRLMLLATNSIAAGALPLTTGALLNAAGSPLPPWGIFE